MAVSNIANLLPDPQNNLPPIAAHCEKHGAYYAARMRNPITDKIINLGCESCSQERKAVEAARAADEERKRLDDKQRKALDRAGIPLRFRGRSFENYEADTAAKLAAFNVAKAFAENFQDNYEAGRCLIFSGKTGTGKTHLANAIANQIIKQGWSPFFITVRELVGTVKATWSKRSDKTELQVIRDFVREHLLIIDEIGVQFDSDAERMILFDVINGRYEEQRPTIILSNYPIDSTDGPSIRKVLGDRVLDRLRENGGKSVQFNWDSYRGAKK